MIRVCERTNELYLLSSCQSCIVAVSSKHLHHHYLRPNAMHSNLSEKGIVSSIPINQYKLVHSGLNIHRLSQSSPHEVLRNIELEQDDASRLLHEKLIFHPYK